MQELTDDAEAGLQQAGLGDLLPYRVTQLVPYGTRGSIYARYPLRGGPPAVPPSAARCTARLDLPSGQFVHLACVHAAPPKPPWSPGATARWRSQLSALPAPGDGPLILAGDFNATLDHAEFRRLLRRGYADAAARQRAVPHLGTATRPPPGPARPQPRPDRPALRGPEHIGPLAARKRPPRPLRRTPAPRAPRPGRPSAPGHQVTATDNRHQAPLAPSPPKTATAREQTSGPDRQSTASSTLASASRLNRQDGRGWLTATAISDPAQIRSSGLITRYGPHVTGGPACSMPAALRTPVPAVTLRTNARPLGAKVP